jgi:DNA-binding protein Fis
MKTDKRTDRLSLRISPEIKNWLQQLSKINWGMPVASFTISILSEVMEAQKLQKVKDDELLGWLRATLKKKGDR